jgi:hypothetical protein
MFRNVWFDERQADLQTGRYQPHLVDPKNTVVSNSLSLGSLILVIITPVHC